MSPVLKHLLERHLDCSEQDIAALERPYSQQINSLKPDFYSKVVPHHILLNFEYGVVRSQLRTQQLMLDQQNKKLFLDQCITALALAELLEQIYLKYLNVPREVRRLRQQQKIYREWLAKKSDITFSSELVEIDPPYMGFNVSQFIRNVTLQTNFYRQFIIRTKRLLDTIAIFSKGSAPYQRFILLLGKVTNRALAHLAWLFNLPRLLSNLFFTLKHTIPGNWMSEEEKSLGWVTRLEAQMQGRWFELANDAVWVAVGLVNCLVLTGALSPIGAYLSLGCFVYDVIAAAVRAYIDLNRLYDLQAEYKLLSEQESDQDAIDFIQEFQSHLSQRVFFEERRLTLHVTVTSLFCIAMMFTIPLLAFNPLFALSGSILLLASTIANFGFTLLLEQTRPKEDVASLPSASELGFFAKKKVQASLLNADDVLKSENNRAVPN